jgi:hypothetical protein
VTLAVTENAISGRVFLRENVPVFHMSCAVDRMSMGQTMGHQSTGYTDSTIPHQLQDRKADCQHRPLNTSGLINQYATARPLRSTDLHLLAVPRSKLNCGARAFRVASPTVWNQLPLNIRTCTSPTAFNRLLKTFNYNSARAAAK